MSDITSTPVLGIDISKKTFHCALLTQGKNKKANYKHKQFSNEAKGYHQLSQWLATQGMTSCHVCLEATGVYGEGVATYLAEAADFTVSIVNPAKIKGFAQCQLQRLKTDKADAKLIAQYCLAMTPQAWQPESLQVRQLQALVKRLGNVGGMLRQEQNRLSVANEVVHASLRKSIQTLEQQREQLQQQIQTHIDQHPELKQRADLVTSIPGIGAATQGHILAFIGNPDRFDSAKQCVAFIGLNPKPFRSGTSVRGKSCMSKTGFTALRAAFYMPAIVAMRHNPILRAFADRLKKAGKHGKVMVCAVMRKLIHIIYGVLKSNQPFRV